MTAEGPSPALAHLQWLVGFHDWARPRISEALRSVPEEEFQRPGAIPGANEDGSVWAAIAHIVGTEEIWYRRWRGEAVTRLRGAAEYPTLPDIEEAWAGLEERRRTWLLGLPAAELEQPLTYRSIRGTEERFPLWQTILHVSNHTTHHRAEVAAALTGLGAPPESVDLIDYMRAFPARS